MATWDWYVPFADLRSQPTDATSPPETSSNAQEKAVDEEHGQQYGTMNKPISPSTPPQRGALGQFRAFGAMAMPFFRENSTGRWLFAGLVVLMILNSTVRVVFSFLARDFWTALADQDEETFYRIMRNFLIALIILAPVNVFYRFQRQRLSIKWREWMTNRVLELYYSNQIYYSLERNYSEKVIPTEGEQSNSNFGSTAIDNPDQRIAEDVRSFTQYSLSLFLTVAVSLIDLAAFSVILFMIEPRLFISIIVFSVMGTITTVIIGKTLIRLNFSRLQKEADFRYSLVRMRDHAESIAFFGGERIEGRQIQQRLVRVIENAKQIIGTQRNLDFFTTLYAYLTWVLPIIVVAPNYFAGKVELGVIQQAAAAFGHVLEDLSIIVTEFEELSEFSAAIGRLSQFLTAIRSADSDRDEGSDSLMKVARHVDGIRKEDVPISTGSEQNMDHSGKHLIHLQTSLPWVSQAPTGTQPALSVQHLTLRTPALFGRTLIRNLSFELQWGQHLLIVGPSGIGKSSLLRAIAGLWTTGAGTINRPNKSDIYFLPQKPYCPLGTLRDQLLYPNSLDIDESATVNALDVGKESELPTPHKRSLPTDKELLDIIHDIGLFDLVHRLGSGDLHKGLDIEVDWGNTLSLGEQQRLAFGRVLANRPRLIILDESTSAVDVAGETRMYSLLQQLGTRGRNQNATKPASRSDVTYISIGHRPTLLAHHDVKLEIKGLDGHTFGEIVTTEGGVSAHEVNQFLAYT